MELGNVWNVGKKLEGSNFFFNDTATTGIYTLALHDALPICCGLTAWPGSVAATIRSIFNSPSSETVTSAQAAT